MSQPRGKDPSIKGTAFQSAPEDLLRLRAEGRISQTLLETRLEADDLEILEQKINPAAWYPIGTYGRMVELLANLEGDGRTEEYCVARGVRAAERLAKAGIYQQLDASVDTLGARIGHFVITLAQMIYNFTHWYFQAGDEEGSFSIEVEDARHFPEVARYATQGFIELAATRTAGRPIVVESERPRPDLVVYRGRRVG